MRSSTSAAFSASRTSSSTELVKDHRALCPFARTLGLVSLTIARWPLCCARCAIAAVLPTPLDGTPLCASHGRPPSSPRHEEASLMAPSGRLGGHAESAWWVASPAVNSRSPPAAMLSGSEGDLAGSGTDLDVVAALDQVIVG